MQLYFYLFIFIFFRPRCHVTFLHLRSFTEVIWKVCSSSSHDRLQWEICEMKENGWNAEHQLYFPVLHGVLWKDSPVKSKHLRRPVVMLINSRLSACFTASGKSSLISFRLLARGWHLVGGNDATELITAETSHDWDDEPHWQCKPMDLGFVESPQSIERCTSGPDASLCSHCWIIL